MLDIEDVTNLLKKTIKKKSKISTLGCQIEDKKFFLNKNVVKVTTKEELHQNNLSVATSFTREIKNTQKNIYHHIGIYIYNVSYLERFVQLEQTQNEKSQKLEQLRLMDNNIEIDVGLAKTKPIGVDTDEDYRNKKLWNIKIKLWKLLIKVLQEVTAKVLKKCTNETIPAKLDECFKGLVR